jgi:hypothetical protein
MKELVCIYKNKFRVTAKLNQKNLKYLKNMKNALQCYIHLKAKEYLKATMPEFFRETVCFFKPQNCTEKI